MNDWWESEKLPAAGRGAVNAVVAKGPSMAGLKAGKAATRQFIGTAGKRCCTDKESDER